MSIDTIIDAKNNNDHKNNHPSIFQKISQHHQPEKMPRMNTISGTLTNRMNAIISRELLKEKRRAGPRSVERDAG